MWESMTSIVLRNGEYYMDGERMEQLRHENMPRDGLSLAMVNRVGRPNMYYLVLPRKLDIFTNCEFGPCNFRRSRHWALLPSHRDGCAWTLENGRWFRSLIVANGVGACFASIRGSAQTQSLLCGLTSPRVPLQISLLNRLFWLLSKSRECVCVRVTSAKC